VIVSGVPNGTTVTVTATGSRGKFHTHNSPTCHHSGGTTWVCTATRDGQSFLFHSTSFAPQQVTFSVTPPDGWTDPAQGNNSRTYTLPGDSGSD